MFADCYKGKKIIVTGHTGFKGSWLVAWLQLLGANVIGIAMQPDTTPSHFELLKFDMESHIIDIREAEKVSKIIKQTHPDMLFHLAAHPLVRDSYNRPLVTFETNILGTANILNACRDLEKLSSIIVVTTDKCYENKEWVWGYKENDPLGGYDPYSASKGCAEIVTASFRNSYFNLDQFGKRHNTLIASARAGNVIGGGDWAKDRLVPDIMKASAKGEIVNIRNPNATRPWQHVLECLSGYLCLGEKLQQGDKIFAEAWNFAPTSEGTVTVLNVVEKMQQVWSQLKFSINKAPNDLHEASLLKLDCSKANAILKWKNVWDIEETVKFTTNWYQEFYENNKVITLDDINAYANRAESLEITWAQEDE